MQINLSKKTLIVIGTVAVVVLSVGAWVYVMNKKTNPTYVADEESTGLGTSTEETLPNKEGQDDSKNDAVPIRYRPAKYTTKVEGYSAILLKDDKVIQTIRLEGFEISGAKFLVEKGIVDSPFVINQDINFDGFMDLSAAVSYGYEGENRYYNYYYFNPKTERFERDALLTEVVNPIFNAKAKTIWSQETDASFLYETIYTFNGKEYVKGKKSEAKCIDDDVCGDHI